MHMLRSSRSSITPKPHLHNQHTLRCRLVVLCGQLHLLPWVSVIAFNLVNMHAQAKIFTMNLQSLQGHLHTTSTHYDGGLLFCAGGCIFFVIQSLLLITCTCYNPSNRHSLWSYLHTIGTHRLWWRLAVLRGRLHLLLLCDSFIASNHMHTLQSFQSSLTPKLLAHNRHTQTTMEACCFARVAASSPAVPGTASCAAGGSAASGAAAGRQWTWRTGRSPAPCGNVHTAEGPACADTEGTCCVEK